MRVVVVGGGEVGQHVARTLSQERHDVTVIDSDAERVESLQEELDALVLHGNGASPRFLRELDAGSADLVCAVTQVDEVNVIAALAAGQLGTARTIARVRDADYFGEDVAFARDVLGIDFVIHPERATAEDLAEAILLPGAVHVEHFGDGRVAVAETVLSNRSPLIGHALSERPMHDRSAVVALVRDGRAVPAEEGHRPRVGDHLLLAAAREDIAEAVSRISGHVAQVRDVVVFGAGRIGLPLVRQLEASGRFQITVLERDRERARYVAERVQRAVVLHEEGLQKEALLAQGVDRAGAFVASAGDDRANLLAALNAKQLGAGLSLAVVSREEYAPLVDALGIDAAVSPRLVTAEAILRAVHGGNVEAVHLLLSGAEVLDVSVEAGCKAEGRTVEDARVLARTRVAVIVRDGQVLIPAPRERVEAGDRLVTFNQVRGVSDVARAFTAAA